MQYQAVYKYLENLGETDIESKFTLHDEGQGVYIGKWETSHPKPTEADLAEETARINNNTPILQELAKLEFDLPRYAEDFQRGRGIKKYDEIIAKKDALRAQLI